METQFLKETILLNGRRHFVHLVIGDVVSTELEIDSVASANEDRV